MERPASDVTRRCIRTAPATGCFEMDSFAPRTSNAARRMLDMLSDAIQWAELRRCVRKAGGAR